MRLITIIQRDYPDLPVTIWAEEILAAEADFKGECSIRLRCLPDEVFPVQGSAADIAAQIEIALR